MWGIFDKGSCKGDAGTVGITDGIGCAAVGNTGNIIDGACNAFLHVIVGQDLAALITHGFYGNALVMGVGIAVVGPQEGTDALLALGRLHLLDAFGGDTDDLAGAAVAVMIKACLLVSKALDGNGITVIILTDQNGQTAIEVARRIEAILGQYQHGHRAVDHALGKTDTLSDGVLLIDEGSDQLGGVDLAAAQLQIVVVLVEDQLSQRILVVDLADRAEGKAAQVAADQQRLGFKIGDTGDTNAAAHLIDIFFKLGAERRVFDVVDLSLEADLTIIHGHTAAACA